MRSGYSVRYQFNYLQGENESLVEENASLREEVESLQKENFRLQQRIARLKNRVTNLAGAELIFDEMMEQNEVDGGYTPLLQHVLSNGSIDCAKIMIEAGSEIHARSASLATALHVAAGRNFKTICQSLIGQGVDIDPVDEVGKSPLHYAAERDAIGAAKALVEAGADQELQDSEGNTPLHCACQFSAYNVAKYLIDSGCDQMALNEDGSTPYDCLLSRPEEDLGPEDRMHELFEGI